MNCEGRTICVSLNNGSCQARPTLSDTNSNETFFYLFTNNANKCRGSCNTIDDPFDRVCVPKYKNMIQKHNSKKN